MNRYKRAAVDHSELATFIQDLTEWYDTWRAGVLAPSPKFADSLDPVQSSPEAILGHLRKGIERLQDIVGRNNISHRFQGPSTVLSGTSDHAHTVQRLQLIYEGPGTELEGGPRHDNDHVSISDIKIAPTHDELVSTLAPYLPYNIPGAPHSYPSSSMQRLLDIHFRLLREELM
jgi:hypothetical protein